MSASPTSPSPARHGLRALLSLVALALAPLSWLWTLDRPFLRSTGATAWLLLAVALGLALSAARRDRRSWVRGIAIAQLAATAAFVWLYFGFSRLPHATAGELVRAPDFTLPDADGRSVTLSQELARGPVLLVFFRGHW